MTINLKTSSLALSLLLLGACADTTEVAVAQEKPAVDKVEKAETEEKKTADIVTTDLGGGVSMLVGEGGNIGVFSGPDGHLVVDDQFARMMPKIMAAIKAIDDKPVKYLINTHYHGDHSGGNIAMHEHGAEIIAHDNVRVRLSTPTESKLWKRTIEPVAPEAWPVITYSNASTIHLNGSSVTMIHTPGAHTDGDSLVFFKSANVLHMGDNYFNNMLPYIDVDSGGSINGMIAAHDLALSMIDDDTKVIPGHGELSTKAELQKARDMLVNMRDLVQEGIDKGESLETIVARNPLEIYAEYGKWITPKIMTEIVFRSLTGG